MNFQKNPLLKPGYVGTPFEECNDNADQYMIDVLVFYQHDYESNIILWNYVHEIVQYVYC